MATGPKWNRQRKCWYVQFWTGKKWRRKTVAPGPPGWREDEPDPDPSTAPPEAYAKFKKLEADEKAARERAESGLPSSLKRFLDEHVDQYDNELTRESARETVGQFLAFCREKGVTEVGEVDPALCKAWVKRISCQAINTVKRKRAQVAAAWGLARKRNEISANPWEGVKPRGQETTKERKAWTREQFDQLLEKGEPKPWLRDLLILGVNTGLRINAIINLEWRDWLKPETKAQRRGYIRVRKEFDKIKRGYKVPISKDLDELLQRRWRDEEHRHPTYILTGHLGGPLCNRNVTGRAIRRACVRAELDDPQSPNHHLRRTFGRWAHYGKLTGKNVPIDIVSCWLGHKSVRTTQIYLGIEDEESAAFMVPDED